MSEFERTTVPAAAAWLGGLGAIPFVGLAALTFTDSALGAMAHPALLGYGAVILSFLGGVQWGVAIARQARGGLLTLSIVPSLVAWVALLLPGRTAHWTMAAAIVALLLIDLALARRGLTPAWYPRLRVPLSTVVALSLMAAALSP